jgi:CHAT domain-containing protein
MIAYLLLASAVVTPLSPGMVLERALKVGEEHRYSVELREGECLQATVEQRGVDVTLTVLGPEGGTLLEADTPTSESGPEPLAFVARTTGVHVVVVKGGEAPSPEPGRYEVRVEAVREPTPADLIRVKAAWAMAESVRLFFGGESKMAESLERQREALAGWKTLGDRRMEMWSENGLGFLLGEYFDQHSQSLPHYRAALGIARSLGEESAVAHILIALGQALKHQGQLDAAREALEESLAMHRAAGRRSREAWVLTALGVISDLTGDVQQALDQLGEAERYYREAGDRRNAAVARTKIGATYLRLGEYELAIEQYRAALPAFEKGERRFEAQSVGQIGIAQAQLGQRAEARASYLEALRLYRDLGNRAYEAYTSLDVGRLDREEGKLRAALDAFTEAAGVFRATGDRAGEGAAHCEAGEARRLLGDRAGARAAFEAARLLISASVPALLCVEQGLARLARDSGDLAGARAHAEKAMEAVESRRASVASPGVRASILAASQAVYELLIDVRMRQHEADPAGGHAAAAFEAGERARARSLLELLAPGRIDVREGADPALLDEERTLRQRLNATAEAQERARVAKRTERAQALEREAAELTARLAEVETRLRRSSPKYAALTQPQPLGLEEVRAQALDAETVLLEYAFGEKNGYLWVVAKDGLAVHHLAAREDIERAAHRVRERLSAPPTGAGAGDWPAAVRELSALVLPPGLDRLAAKRLLVVAPGALQYVPFALLPVPGAERADSLLARFEVVSAPSASVAAALRAEGRSPRPPVKSVAVFADPVFDSTDPRVEAAPKRVASLRTAPLERALRNVRSAAQGGPLARLPFSRREAEAILASAPGRGFSALGFDATRSAATSADLTNYGVVHFATHALLNTRQPELSGIVLSLVDRRGQPQDGFLRLHDVYNLRLGADLVVLSGCQTGLGREVRGEGLLGLTRGFMYAGAPRVVASLWQVDDLATAELMKRFYRGLFTEKLPPAAALRAAQRELAESPRWREPYYWAAFGLHGDWR